MFKEEFLQARKSYAITHLITLDLGYYLVPHTGVAAAKKRQGANGRARTPCFWKIRIFQK